MDYKGLPSSHLHLNEPMLTNMTLREADCVYHLRFLRDRLCLLVPASCLLNLAFPAPETFALDLDTPTGGEDWLTMNGVSEEVSWETGNTDVFPAREARMVT